MRHRTSLLLLFSLTSSLGACSSSHLFYETTAIKHEALPSSKKASLISQIEDEFDDHKIVWVDPEGKERKIQPKGEGLRAMDMAALHALWMTSAMEDIEGAELDLMIAVQGGERTPVSVLVGLEDSIRVISGPRSPKRLPKASEPDEISERYRIGELKGERGIEWSESAYKALEAALGRLSSEELAVLKGMDFVRRKQSQNPRKGAFYFQKGCTATIYIYNNSLSAAKYQFAGDPDAPLPPMTLTTLHEIGHAVHERPAFLAGCALARQIKDIKKQQKAYNEDVATRNRLAKRARKDRSAASKVKAMDADLTRTRDALLKAQSTLESERDRVASLAQRGPVIAAFEKALQDSDAPTKYGETSSKEAFAESFALYHADPSALRRALPHVHAWFEAKGHLAALE